MIMANKNFIYFLFLAAYHKGKEATYYLKSNIVFLVKYKNLQIPLFTFFIITLSTYLFIALFAKLFFLFYCLFSFNKHQFILNKVI